MKAPRPIPKPGKAPLNLFHLVNGPVYLHASLPPTVRIVLIIMIVSTYALFHGSFAFHSLPVAALCKVLMSNPVTLGGAILAAAGRGERWFGREEGDRPGAFSVFPAQTDLDVNRVVEASKSLTARTVNDETQLLVKRLSFGDAKARSVFVRLSCVTARCSRAALARRRN